MTDCPGPSDLRRLDSDSLRDSSFAALERHLEHCLPCRDVLERRDGLADAPGFPEPLPGYRIDHELGRGGMGVVYRATRLADGLPVALKYLAGGPDDRARWVREAEAMRRVSDPGVVRLLDVGEAGGWFCLVLDYLPGGNLAGRLDPAPSPRSAARIVETIARAVEKVHASGVLHLDLKPSNILLGGAPGDPLELCRPVVTDFGLALPCGDPEATWTIAAGPRGTPSYMAPEQLSPDRSAIGPATDVFALGAILYRMLTGRPPFLASSKRETYLQLRDRDPIPPRRLNPAVPPDLETICLACLRKRPRRRYPSARALADDLRRFLAGQRIVQRPTPRPVLLVRWCRRHRLATGLAAAGVLAVGLMMGVQSARLRASRSEQARAAREVARLEENLVLSSEVLRAYQDYSDTTLFRERSVDGGRLLDRLDALRAQLRRSWRAGRIDAANLASLGQLSRMATDLAVWSGRPPEETFGRAQEARAALDEAVRLAPDLVYYRACQAEARIVAIVLEIDVNPDRAEPLAEEAIGLVKSLRVPSTARPTVRTLGTMLIWIAQKAYLRGDLAANRRWLTEALGLLEEHGTADDGGGPYLTYCRAVAELGLGNVPRARELRSSVPTHFGVLDAGLVVNSLTDRWMVYMLGASSGLLTLGEGLDHRVPGTPAEHADFLVEEIEASGLPWNDALESAMRAFSILATSQRHTGDLDRAEQIASHYLAVASEVARRRPGSAAAHSLLAEAFQHQAKNAWRRDDLPSVRRWLLASIAASEAALSLDPESPLLRSRLADRRRRLSIVPAVAE